MTTSEQNQSYWAQRIESWGFDPLKFVNDNWPKVTVTNQQAGILKASGEITRAKVFSASGMTIPDEMKEMASKKGISVRSGQGIGKDAVAAWLIIWFLCVNPYSKVMATAGTKTQIRDVLWSEIEKWVRLSKEGMEGESFVSSLLEVRADKVVVRSNDDSRKDGKEWFAAARTCGANSNKEAQAGTLLGRHSDYQLFVFDEAAMVPDAVWTPVLGTMTGLCNWALVIFNPVRNTGEAAKTHKDNKGSWVCLHYNSEESPLVSRDSLAAQELRFHGKDTDDYRVFVRGEFPVGDKNQIVPFEWAYEAVDAQFDTTDNDPLKVGLDVGAGRDCSVLVARKGPIVKVIERFSSPDSNEVVAWAASKIMDIEDVCGEKPDEIAIDKGGVGWGPYNSLRKDLPGYKVVGVHFAGSPDDKERYARKMDEMWWRMREAFQNREISIPNDERLILDLTGRKKPEGVGKIRIQSKSDMNYSPDAADALALTFNRPDKLCSRNKKHSVDAYLQYAEDDYFLEGKKNLSWMSV